MYEVVRDHGTAVQPDVRTTHHIVLGIDRDVVPVPTVDMAVEELKIDITRLAGGVTVIKGEGTWTPEAEAGVYSGPIEHDLSVNIILTFTPDEGRKVWPKVAAAIRGVVQRFQLGCEHIHSMVWQARSRIFSVSDKEDSPKLLTAPQRSNAEGASDA